MEIALGSEVEDITTGFKGIVTNRTEYMNGCIQYFVEPPVDKKTGELNKGWHIDVQILKVLGPGISEEYPLNTNGPLRELSAGRDDSHGVSGMTAAGSSHAAIEPKPK